MKLGRQICVKYGARSIVIGHFNARAFEMSESKGALRVNAQSRERNALPRRDAPSDYARTPEARTIANLRAHENFCIFSDVAFNHSSQNIRPPIPYRCPMNAVYDQDHTGLRFIRPIPNTARYWSWYRSWYFFQD